MLMTSMLLLALSAPTPQARTLQLQPMAHEATDKARVLEQLYATRKLHRLHAHIAADGRTVIGCELSHRHTPDMRSVLRGTQVRP
jgi:hypothetical protein